MTNDQSLNSSHDEFSWTEYLNQTGAEAAPWSCFCQNNPPPVNEFREGQRLETYDPRNTSSICLALIVEVAGPRLKLRLEGTDDRNDFWLMCDSDLLHPFEYSARLGRKLSPPLGFANDLSKWPKSLEKFIQQATEKNLFAPETCFRTSPTRPPRNEFRPGHKLEAVDPKNPHLICPASVKEVNRDQLVITFDGWSLSSQFSISYTSRDLFPCGWCKQSGHDLQPPGNLEKKENPRVTNESSKTIIATTTTVPVKKPNTIRIVLKSSKQYQNKNDSTPQLLDKSSDSSFTEAMNSTMDKSKNKSPTKNVGGSGNQLDLSAIKSEAVDMDEQEQVQQSRVPDQPPRLELVKLNETTNLVNHVNKSDLKTVVVYVNPNASPGPAIKASKFHKTYRRFGPGSPQSVYKSLAQGLIDCACERYKVFYVIPEGKSIQTVKCVTLNGDFRKRISVIESEEDLWRALHELCQLLSIDCNQLFSVKPYKSTPSLIPPLVVRRSGTELLNSATNSIVNKLNGITAESIPSTTLQTPQTSSSVSSSIESSGQTAEAVTSNRLGITVSPHKPTAQPPSIPPPPLLNRPATNVNNNKRRISQNASKNDETNDEQDQANHTISSTTVTPPKLPRTSSTNSVSGANAASRISEWNVEQVATFISKINDNYFSSFANLFRHHEIDGKALLLLNTELIMRYMGFKLGPALKLNNYLDRLKQHSSGPLTNDL